MYRQSVGNYADAQDLPDAVFLFFYLPFHSYAILSDSADSLKPFFAFILPQNLCFINPYYYHIIHYHY